MDVHNLNDHPRRINEWVQEDAAIVAMLRGMGADGEALLLGMIADMERQMELVEPAAGLLPELPLQFYPALLALLGRVRDGAELAVKLARDSLLENEEAPTGDAITALVTTRYLPTNLLVGAERAHPGSVLPAMEGLLP